MSTHQETPNQPSVPTGANWVHRIVRFILFLVEGFQRRDYHIISVGGPGNRIPHGVPCIPESGWPPVELFVNVQGDSQSPAQKSMKPPKDSERDSVESTALLASSIARKAHEGQFRRDGATPYIAHPEAVAKSLEGEHPYVIAAAWLHDVLEDTHTSVVHLKNAGIPLRVIDAVELLTRGEGDRYEDYLHRIAQDEIARKVKIADIRHNLSDGPTGNQRAKYAKALRLLANAESIHPESKPDDAEQDSGKGLDGTPCSASYRGYIHVLHGAIWEERETLDLSEYDGLVDAFTAAMAKCQGVSMRSGMQTRIMFVCEPNA